MPLNEVIFGGNSKPHSHRDRGGAGSCSVESGIITNPAPNTYAGGHGPSGVNEGKLAHLSPPCVLQEPTLTTKTGQR